MGRAPRRRDRRNPVRSMDGLRSLRQATQSLVGATRAHMTSSGTRLSRASLSGIRILLCAFALSLLSAVPTWAINCVADAGGIIDGFVNYPVPPSQINLDGNCIIRNYPPSN